MFLTSRAIVLNKVRHTDTTFITTLYTEQAGSVAFVVKMPRSAKTRLKVQLLQPLALLTVEWDHRPASNLQRLHDVQIEAPYSSLTSQPERAPLASLLSEALHHALSYEHQGEVYPFIHRSLTAIDHLSGDAANAHLVFLLQLARQLGIAPAPFSMVNGQRYFDLLNAEYTATQPEHKYYLNHQDARRIPLILRLTYPTMHRVRLTPSQRQRALTIILTYYRLHIPGFPKLRSADILAQL
ncbi:MAG: DNA repair protein RecO [Bacteroidaceae bacterium]|nr:DNA repair protein RecO [Bacteroidaceae bacterium]